MAYKIRINPAAFTGTNPLVAYALNQAAARVVVGPNSDERHNIPTTYPPGEIRGPSGIEATLDGQTFQDEVFTRVMTYSLKAQLADLVRKNVLIVELNGVAQTVTQIMA